MEDLNQDTALGVVYLYVMAGKEELINSFREHVSEAW